MHKLIETTWHWKVSERICKDFQLQNRGILNFDAYNIYYDSLNPKDRDFAKGFIRGHSLALSTQTA